MKKIITGMVIGYFLSEGSKKITNFLHSYEDRIINKITGKLRSEKNLLPKDLNVNKSEFLDKIAPESSDKMDSEIIITDDPNMNYFVLEDYLDKDTVKKITNILKDIPTAKFLLELGMGDLKNDSETKVELYCGPVRIVTDDLKDFFQFLAYHKEESKDIPYKFVKDASYDTNMKIGNIIIPVKIILQARQNDVPYEDRKYIIEIKVR